MIQTLIYTDISQANSPVWGLLWLATIICFWQISHTHNTPHAHTHTTHNIHTHTHNIHTHHTHTHTTHTHHTHTTHHTHHIHTHSHIHTHHTHHTHTHNISHTHTPHTHHMHNIYTTYTHMAHTVTPPTIRFVNIGVGPMGVECMGYNLHELWDMFVMCLLLLTFSDIWEITQHKQRCYHLYFLKLSLALHTLFSYL